MKISETFQMDDEDPTSFINIIKDLRKSTGSYSQSTGVPFSGISYATPIFNKNDEDIVSPKRAKLDEPAASAVNQNQSDSVPSSPWEWRRLKGEVILFDNL